MQKIGHLTEKYAKHALWHRGLTCHNGKDAVTRLQVFAPAISYFILAFRDFNEFVLPYPDPKSELEKALNLHALEDSTHYKLFIEDWEKLGGDKLLTPYDNLIAGLPEDDHRVASTKSSSSLNMSSKMLSFLWSDPTNRHSRKLMFALTQLINQRCQAAPTRFAAVEAVEETGRVMFEATARLAAEASKATGESYRYFGDYHLALETGHVINGSNMNGATSGGCSCEADEPFKTLPLSIQE